MAKDDYHVIVYRVLAYLYAVLKSGEEIEVKFLSCVNLQIPKAYWLYIWEHLAKDEFVENLQVFKSVDS